jgi:hypothetical protein
MPRLIYIVKPSQFFRSGFVVGQVVQEVIGKSGRRLRKSTVGVFPHIQHQQHLASPVASGVPAFGVLVTFSLPSLPSTSYAQPDQIGPAHWS